MKDFARSVLLASTALLVTSSVFAQEDEIRQATGLPMMVGENVARGNMMNVTGKITLEGVERLKRRPVITITVFGPGGTADRTVANDGGFYIVKNIPRQNSSIVVEVDSQEVIRQPLIPSAMGNPRFDTRIPWPLPAVIAKPGVVNVPSYQRSDKNDELFKKAVEAARKKDAAKAGELFNELLSADPKDYVAWTELGTMYFSQNSLDNAEACYFKAIELKKDYFVALLHLGELYLNRKQSENAVLVLSNAVKAAPNSADAHHYLGEAYLQVKKGSLAVEQLNAALKLAPVEKADLHLRLGKLYDAAGMKDKASLEYSAYLKKRPDYADKKQLEKYIADNPAK